MYIAILGFGYEPPIHNLMLAEKAVDMLVKQDFGIAVGNVCGTFLTALETVDRWNAQGMAVIDDSMSIETLPTSIKIKTVSAEEKHDRIAELVSAGLILGGATGTLKLSRKLLKAGQPVAAVKGTGGAVDDGSLSDLIPQYDTVAEAVEYLSTELATSSVG